jgi:hypothetical protein
MAIPYFHTGFWWVMNTVDPRWIHGIDFEDVNSLLHIMIRNKDTDVFLILTLPFYGTSSIRKRSEHRFIPDTYRRRFPHVAVLWNIFCPKTIQTPIYSGYLPETFSTRRLLSDILQPIMNTY